MVPVLQFDPASLAIFADWNLVSEDPEIAFLVEATICCHPGALLAGFKNIKEPKRRTLALQLTSSFLHEKRHFLDFSATNYGAFRFRQFLEIYRNIPGLLSYGRQQGHLCVPLDVYLDPIRRRVLNTPEPPEELSKLAASLARRRKMVEKDRTPYRSRLGTFEIGGEAQLEALAYLAQNRFLRLYAGVDGLTEFHDSLYDFEEFSKKYGCMFQLGAASGVTPILGPGKHREGEDFPRGMLRYETGLLECAIFASLQADYVPRENPRSAANIETSYPAERLAGLLFYLKQDFPSLCEVDGFIHWNECWSAVNTTCSKIFGRSVSDQMYDDIQFFGRQNAMNGHGENDHAYRLGKSFTKLREEIYEKFVHDPMSVASTEVFAASVGALVDPVVVATCSQGAIGEPSDRLTRIMGYEAPIERGSRAPWQKWWWASAVEEYDNFTAIEESLRLSDKTVFYSAMDVLAPIAKLVMNGRRIRTIIGPEILFAEQQMRNLADCDLKVMPGFDFPDDEIPESVMRYYARGRAFHCDLLSEHIPEGEATVLTPWAVRRYPDLARKLVSGFGNTDFGYHAFVRDWSPWIFGKKAMLELRPLMESQGEQGSIHYNR